jgi:hypothetical protein
LSAAARITSMTMNGAMALREDGVSRFFMSVLLSPELPA